MTSATLLATMLYATMMIVNVSTCVERNAVRLVVRNARDYSRCYLNELICFWIRRNLIPYVWTETLRMQRDFRRFEINAAIFCITVHTRIYVKRDLLEFETTYRYQRLLATS